MGAAADRDGRMHAHGCLRGSAGSHACAHLHTHKRRCTGERASARTAGRDTCIDFVGEA
jgi:hypothetical protein